MSLFKSHNFQKMVAEGDRNGLYQLLQHDKQSVRMEAAQALAELEDGFGWRYLTDALRQTSDQTSQATAAEILGDLGQPRAIPALEEALKEAHGETAQAMVAALESIGGAEADEALRRAGYEPVLPHMTGSQQIMDFGGNYVRNVGPEAVQVKFLTADQHFEQAASLHETGLTEPALIENSLALWLSPDWGQAWQQRGMLFESLERLFEAALCFRWALELDPGLHPARETLSDLEAENEFPPLDVETLLVELNSGQWTKRRDAAAGLGELGEGTSAAGPLIDALDDDEREVRHAVIEALGNIGDVRAVQPLVGHQENSWLLRFVEIEALAQLGSVSGLSSVLHHEMDQIQQRNPVFSDEKDPLLEVEYSRVMEIGALAFEKAGDLDALLDIVEGNVWVEAEDEEEEQDEELAADEDLESYVDEVSQMASLALERLATPNLSSLPESILVRLSSVPDLTLLDITQEQDHEPQPITIHDLSALREAARAELARRKRP